MEMVGYLRNAHREDWHTELAVAATLSYLSRHRMVLLHLDANKLKSSRRAPALLFFAVGFALMMMLDVVMGQLQRKIVYFSH